MSFVAHLPTSFHFLFLFMWKYHVFPNIFFVAVLQLSSVPKIACELNVVNVKTVKINNFWNFCPHQRLSYSADNGKKFVRMKFKWRLPHRAHVIYLSQVQFHWNYISFIICCTVVPTTSVANIILYIFLWGYLITFGVKDLNDSSSFFFLSWLVFNGMVFNQYEG